MDRNPSWSDGLLAVAFPMVWGAAAAVMVVFAMTWGKPATVLEPSTKLATVDIAKIMQEYNGRVLRDPNDQQSVNWALEESARAAAQLDPLMKHLSTELHPGYTLIQPQALAYHGEGIPDFTDELRVLLLKRTGKFNKDLDGYAPLAAPTAEPGASGAKMVLPSTTATGTGNGL